MGNKKVINHTTGEKEPYISPWRIIPRRFISLSIVLFYIAISLSRAFAIAVYRTVVGQDLATKLDANADKDGFHISSGMVTSLTASTIDTIVIVMLDFIFEK